MSVEIDYAGPILTGQATRITAAMCGKIEQELAARGVKMVKDDLDHVLKHPTGYYKSHVVVAMDGDLQRITDSGVVYGPWLEGVSRRNQATRFKGYSTFRRVAQALEKQAMEIAENVVSASIGDLQ